ncbi:MAG TPA: ABC transporter ATP-binding protein [Gammaproteobacteria bacterium]|nr:ABC transporter ATP-binding protein [Gammaproteobacteria bacterium]
MGSGPARREEIVIELSAVTKRYAPAEADRPALDGIDLSIDRGEFVAVMGPSGCGKTTLLNIVGLIDTPTTGRYLFANQDLAGRSENELTELRKHNIAFIFQAFQLIPELSVYENVELPLRYQPAPRARRRTAVREVLELVGLDARARDYPEALSGGEQQRVAIARALVNDPKLILADEPTGNLDQGNGTAVLDMLCTLNRAGATIIVVTHSPACAERADRVVHLLDGRVVGAAHARI